MQFYSDSGYLKSHNNLDLEIKLMLPHNQILVELLMCQLVQVLGE